jgi:hypothetical protein
MTVLSRFSMNNAAATGAVTCERRWGICLWESAARWISLQYRPARLPADVVFAGEKLDTSINSRFDAETG